MSLYDDLKAGGYLDPVYGMVSNQPHHGQPGPNCDNYFLFTAQATRLAYITGQPWYKFLASTVRCYHDSEIEPGLFHRFPGRTDDISQDELYGLASVSVPIAQDIYDYGVTHKWCFNAANPGKFDFRYCYARYINLIPFIKNQAGKKVGILGRLLWSIACITSALSEYGETSGKLLMWIQTYWMQKSCPLTVKLWNYLMKRKYKGGLKEVMTIYFGEKHPFVKYAPETF